MSRPRYYITTPIYYATDAPHIGHTYTTVAGDVAARYRRMTGHDVFYLTGTDEHGQKMERQAAEEGVSPAALADRTAPRYAELWQRLGISHDDFIRTTEPRHRAAVLEMWSRMTAKGDIYEGEYEGPYCVQCESFYSDKDLTGGKCPDHGTVPDKVKEKGFFFRLSAYQEPLLEHYEQHPEFVRPQTRLNEVKSFVGRGLLDLSISRATTKWGIAVPDKPEQVIYVWVDALTNYLSATGFPAPDEASRWWPADVHLVGKDILRFHAIYWPAFLMSAGLELPRQIYSHGWWLREQGDDKRKISKSGGPVKVEPLLETFPVDAVRYFLVREIPFGLDGTYSEKAFVRRYNSDLANDLGNLIQRTLRLVKSYGDGCVPSCDAAPDELEELAARAVATYREKFDELAFSRGVEAAWELVRAGNRFIDERKPWELAKDESKRAELDDTLAIAAELVRLAVTLLWPVMPTTCERARRFLGLAAEPDSADELAWGRLPAGTAIADFEALFPRVDERRWLASIKAEAETPDAAAADEGDAAAGGDGLLGIDEFFRTKLRTARVLAAERIKKSKKLLKLQIDLGDEKRQLVAGIAETYEPDELVGCDIVVVANLKPAKLMGVESQGMLLAATVDGKPTLATFVKPVPPGTQVS